MPNTREKLIELLETVVPQEEVLCCGEVQVSTSRVADHLIANGVTILTEPECEKINIKLPKEIVVHPYKPKWIPVTERLPDKGGSYLVFSSKSKTVFTAHYWLGDRWSNRANGQFITHWMPLPEAPKGE